MKFRNLTISKYLKLLASDAPVPGGGGTSALVAALGASLGIMVERIIEKKAKSTAEQQKLAELRKKLVTLSRDFERTIDHDVKVYEALMRTYRQTKTQTDKARRKRLVDTALERSFLVQQQLAGKISGAAGLVSELEKTARGSIANDLKVAAALLQAAWQGAYATAEINVVYVNDARRKQHLARVLKNTRVP